MLCCLQAVAAAAAVLNVVVQHTAADAWSLVGEAVLSLAQKVWGGEHSAETQASSSSAAAAAVAAHQGQQEVPAEVVSCMVTFCSNINKDCPQEQLQARTQQLAQLMALASRAGTWRVVERAQAVLQELLNSPSHSSGIVDLAAGGQQGIIAVLCQTLLAAASAAAAAEGDEGRVEPRAEVLGLDVEADERRSDRFLEHHRGGEDQVAGCQRRRKDG